MTPPDWELHHSPHRHYKHKGSWNIRGTRILSVTAALDESGDRLWQWAVGQAYLASEHLTGATDLPSAAWGAGMGPEAIRDKAALLGTAAHEGLAALALGTWRGAKLESSARADKLAADRLSAEAGDGRRVPPIVAQSDLWPRFTALEAFWADHTPRTTSTETAVGCAKHVYAGTFDWSGSLAGYRGLVLLDAKNTNMPSYRHPVQVAAYEAARRSSGFAPAKHLLVLYLTPYGTYSLLNVRNVGGYAACRSMFLRQLLNVRAQRTIDRAITKHESS